MKKINEKNYSAITEAVDQAESRLWAKVKRLSASYKSRFDAYTDMKEIGELATAIESMRKSIHAIVEE